jgi:hypothetical protein
MINHHICKVFSNTIYLAYIPEKVMVSENDYINKPQYEIKTDKIELNKLHGIKKGPFY